MSETSGERTAQSEQKTDGTKTECFKCGASIRRRLSAYESWDELITLKWRPDSENQDHVTVSNSGGKHPETVVREFCSVDCMEAFVQMDYSLKLKPESKP